VGGGENDVGVNQGSAAEKGAFGFGYLEQRLPRVFGVRRGTAADDLVQACHWVDPMTRSVVATPLRSRLTDHRRSEGGRARKRSEKSGKNQGE
jgi:hypothetical protein